jgi:hypothetical protein
MSEKPTYEELEQQVREFKRAKSKRKNAEEIQREYKERFALLVEQTRAYISVKRKQLMRPQNFSQG